MNVVATIVAGIVFATIFCIGWAASLMDGRDWFYLTLLSAIGALLIYGRGWLAALIGLSRRPRGERREKKTAASRFIAERNAVRELPAREVLYKRIEAATKANGHTPHHQHNKQRL